jgi:hypothetical protein
MFQERIRVARKEENQAHIRDSCVGVKKLCDRTGGDGSGLI